MNAGASYGWSYLFVPASRLDRVSKALTLPTEVIVDLEDSVAADEKVDARARLSRCEFDRQVYVRINAVGTEYFRDDVSFCNSVSWIKGIVLPKVSSASDVAMLARWVTQGIETLALIETPQGILAADQIATSGASRLLFGSVDYSATLNTPGSDELYSYPRTRMVLASAIAGLPAPVDGPTPDFHDPQRLLSQLRCARALGMGGKLCIHPSQLPWVVKAFGPTTGEREWARKVLEAADVREDAVFALNGEMIDAPVVARARNIMQERK